MKTFQIQKRIPSIFCILLLLPLIFMLTHSCKTEKKEIPAEPEKEVVKNNYEVDITTENMEFFAPDTIPSGWTTWTYHNKSTQPHFILIDDYIDTITMKEFKEQLLPPFGEGISKMYEGKNEEAFAAFDKIPEWYASTTWPGGVGLISPGKTAVTTLFLDPGFYIFECYVKMSNGMFHTNMGMYKALIVSEEKSTLSEPTADYEISISSEAGITGTLPDKPGTYVLSVSYIDQKKYDNFQGHDVNLVKIAEDTELAVLENWMNWLNLDGLIDPVPEGFTFLGGVNDMPAGHKGYFKVTLDPGKYALISEVPKPSEMNLLKTFEISE
ncbi:hypothetical protein [Robertkochia solimangrovi]|uniref:hypothetical protein n=1 Tax=Robertkochia solimangrovi TaxID=2213046 RepID=UPI00117EB0C5|nr:hypothetical protein [Robertkochia solimangrovi]TRZ46339.1 hypothetical protein DMZ48_03535 [Robertkochia solimangrovi]